ncbi:cation:proton antiporter [bacterium]|nr:cation:proton antiporter [bacterium]
MGILLEIFISIRDTFNNHIIFGVGILLLFGYLFGKLSEKLRLPAITGYILAGLILGDSVTGVIHHEMSITLRTITDIALGIIAITIGGEFCKSKLKRLGKSILIITVIQLFVTFGIVVLALSIFKYPLFYALLLGAIASATAPAATVVIIQSLRARGDFVDTLYGIVALDDAGCIILFASVFSFIGGMLGLSVETESFTTVLFHALSEIGFSILIGAIGGALLHLVIAHNNNPKEILILSLGTIFLITAISISLNLSSLLSNMAAGAVLINMSRKNIRVFHVIAPLTPPLYAVFFAIAGTELKIDILLSGSILFIGSIYVISRMIGKYSGVWIGALVSGCNSKVKKYLGLSMIPQAGVAIGLVLFIQASPIAHSAPENIKLALDGIVNIVLFSVLINELIGPPLSKFAIIRGADL